MSESSDPSGPYRPIYSERVRREVKALLTRPASMETARRLLDAVKGMDAVLRIYPQFGEPLRDLSTEGETLWVGVVSPLVVQYIIDEPRRLVFVVAPPKLLSKWRS